MSQLARGINLFSSNEEEEEEEKEEEQDYKIPTTKRHSEIAPLHVRSFYTLIPLCSGRDEIAVKTDHSLNKKLAMKHSLICWGGASVCICTFTSFKQMSYNVMQWKNSYFVDYNYLSFSFILPIFSTPYFVKD